MEILKYLLNKDHILPEKCAEIACENGNVNILEFLVALGFKVTSENINIACESNHFDVVEYLLDIGHKPSADIIYNVVKNGAFETLRILIDYGHVNKDVFTDLLYIASESGRTRIIKYLVSIKGVTVSQYMVNIVCQKFNVEALKFFIRKGYKPTKSVIAEVTKSYQGDNSLTCVKMMYEYLQENL